MMTTQRKPKASKFLTVPTRPIPVDRDRSVAGLLEKMEGAGFGAKQLAESHRIWLDMLDDNSTIYLCCSGNLIPSGMRRLLAYVVKNRFVDVLVLSGKVIFHDIHETLGRNHYQAHPSMSDDELDNSEVYRVGDMLSYQEEYHEADEWIGSVMNQLDLTRSYSIREFLHLLGRELAEIAHEDGILTSAFKSRVPIFCPDLLGSELSVGIARSRFEKKIQFNTGDPVKDFYNYQKWMIENADQLDYVTHSSSVDHFYMDSKKYFESKVIFNDDYSNGEFVTWFEAQKRGYNIETLASACVTKDIKDWTALKQYVNGEN